ncbi:MAG: serine/threonine protein kinase, partial [Holophagales bacterium]|nr:serine/threonine protein kinase [Holophagales bacterium]
MEVDRHLPTAIGPYRVIGLLGRGGMGEVLRGHDDRLDRPVALKRVLPDAREPEKALRRFRREARAAARLSHPSIVQVHDWAESEGHHWLVMELVEGRSLAQVISDGPLPPERALEIGRDIASGLAEAHEAGLVHRDLKTSNILLDTKGRAKILDFGLVKPVRPEATGGEPGGGATSKQSSALTGVGRIVGTATAMSPEQALGKKVDPRSDLFSLGILLYEMSSGVSPFEGETPVETLTRVCSTPEEPLHRLDPEIPEDLSRLVSHLLEKDPARRPANAHQVVEEIERLSSDSSPRLEAPDPDATASHRPTAFDLEMSPPTEGIPPTEPRPASEGEPPPRKDPGRARVLVGAAVGLASVVALGLWGMAAWLDPPGEDPSGAGADSATPLLPAS